MDTTAARTTKCLRCGRALRSATSVAVQLGRHCKAKIAAAAKTAPAKPAQVEKAVELIELAAIVPVRKGRVFRVVASNGIDTYLSAATNCTCPAGRNQRVCYHELAVQFLCAA